MVDRTADLYAESLADGTTTSSTYAVKSGFSQSFTGSASTDYWLFTSCLNWMTVTTVQQQTRLRNTTDSVTICEVGFQQKDATDQTHFFGIGKFTTTGSPSAKSFELQHASSNNSATKHMSDAGLLILKAHASDHYAESLAGSTITNTAGQDAMATLSFTEDGDYIVIGYFEASISSVSPRMQASLDINGSKTKIIENDWSVTGQFRNFWFMDKVTASGAQTYKVTAGLTSSGTITWRNAKVLALRVDSFPNVYYGEQDTRQTNASTGAWGDVATLTATPVNTQHLVLGTMMIDCSSTTTSAQGRFIEGATVKGGVMIEEPDTIGTSDQNCVGAMYVATLAAASTTWKTQIEPETNTAGGDDSSIAVIQLTLTSGDITASPTGVAGTGAAGSPTIITDVTLTPTGVAGTGAAGDPTIVLLQTALPSGVAGTGAAGDVTVTGDANVTPTGVAGTGAVGDPTIDLLLTVSPTGVAGTGAAGDPVITVDVSVAPTGVSGTGAVGDPAITIDLTIVPTGVSGTGAVGDPTITGDANVFPAGVAGTGAVGDPVIVVDVTEQVAGTDTALPMITESSSIHAALGTSESATPKITESAALFARVAGIDTAAPVITEGTAIDAALSASDTLPPKIVETPSIRALLAVSDNIDIATSENGISGEQIPIPGNDNSIITIIETASVKIIYLRKVFDRPAIYDLNNAAIAEYDYSNDRRALYDIGNQGVVYIR